MICPANALVRPIQPSEIALANHWAIQEGWNPGLHDATVFNAVEPGSLLLLEVEGVPAGVISATRMTPDFGFVGFFVLAPEYRRARHAWTLLQASLDRMEQRIIGSETISQLVRTYARYGMRPHYQTVSYHGFAATQPAPWHPAIVPTSEIDPEELAAYDAANAGVPRGAYLRAWLALPQSRTLAFLQNGNLRGFVAARRCHRGVRIGPLQADNPEVAEALFDAVSGLAPGEEISIDCPDINPDSARLAVARGLRACSSTTRLYRGSPPKGRLERVYGLMSFALG